MTIIFEGHEVGERLPCEICKKQAEPHCRFCDLCLSEVNKAYHREKIRIYERIVRRFKLKLAEAEYLERIKQLEMQTKEAANADS